MERWKRRTVELIGALAFGEEGDVSVVPYYPQKCEVGREERRYFRRSLPERHGIASGRIYNMLSELEREPRANLHSIMVFSGDEVISECSAPGYDVCRWHVSHSMAKTVTGMIVGILVGEGELSVERRLVDIFPEIPTRDKRFPEITVENLLTMTSGVEFAEAGAVTETEWTGAFFSSTVRFAPGTRFAYNSMNSYILARVCERVSGEPFGSLAREKFFAPLGIDSYLWEKSPEGVEKGGWGLYMSLESWARIGNMMTHGGVFEGKRVLPESWIVESTKTRTIVPEINGNFNYGYHIWVSRDGCELLFNGMLGQNVWLCPRTNIMVVMTGGNNEIFQASPALEIVRGHLGGEIRDEMRRGESELLREKEESFFSSRRWVRPARGSRGILYRLGLSSGGFDFGWYGIMGSYAVSQNRAGMLPLILRAMQNNFASGIDSISIKKVGRELWLSYVEGGEEYSLKVGLGGYEPNMVTLRGEKYLVLAMGEARWSATGEREYRIELLLPETANVRQIRITRGSGETIRIELLETPNNRLLEAMLETYSKDYPKLGMGIDILDKRIGKGKISDGLRETFSPTLIGVDMLYEGYMAILDEENKKTAEIYRRSRPLKNIIDRLFGDREKEGKLQ